MDMQAAELVCLTALSLTGRYHCNASTKVLSTGVNVVSVPTLYGIMAYQVHIAPVLSLLTVRTSADCPHDAVFVAAADLEGLHILTCACMCRLGHIHRRPPGRDQQRRHSSRWSNEEPEPHSHSCV